MTKLKVVVLLAVVVLLLFPAMAFAQGPQLPCRFHGEVQVDGENVADGTSITATIEGETYTAVTPTTAYGPSTYELKIIPPEGTEFPAGAQITFMIGAVAAGETGTFGAGSNVELNLSSGEAPVTGNGVITDVVVTTLAAGASATADYDAETGILTLGIPAGAQGEDGTAGTAGAAGAQGEAGEDAVGGIVLPIIALVIAILAAGMAIMSMRRRV